ncbi:MAG: hypothetical protein J0J04_04980 [Microbacterium sp.]|uniref:hypothetical protein n=1 Tax=Microbacterium sp. TaxID=51671 RepID=UPI001ACDD02C|nr:hypothetical protein [Microbacterium sp.]MBN9214162.1 hypothetical protein [Microbacterium sp.]
MTDSGAQLRVMPDHLSLHIDGQSPLDDSDGDPVSPPGWWEQVDRLGGVVFLAVVPTGTPFHPEGLAGAHKQLLDSPETATALVPVIHA